MDTNGNPVANMICSVLDYLLDMDGRISFYLCADSDENTLSIKDKKDSYLYLLRPFMVGILFWSAVYLSKEINQFIENYEGTVLYALWKFFSGLTESDEVSDFPILSNWLISGTVYFALYRFVEASSNKQLKTWGGWLCRVFPGLKDTISSIYYQNPSTQKIRLTDRWIKVRRLCSVVVIAEAFLFVIINNRGLGIAIYDFDTVFITSLTGFMFLMETVHYLSYDLSDENKSKTESELNLVKLRMEIQQYSKDKDISIVHYYDRNVVFIREKLESSYDLYEHNHDASVEFLKKFLDEKNQYEYIDLGVRLLNGENIFYASPFYKDIDASIFVYMFLNLLRNKKCLVLVEDNGEMDKLVTWIRGGLDNITGVKYIWNVGILEETSFHLDIGVMAYQSICSDQRIDQLPQFLSEVSFGVVLGASDLLNAGQESVHSFAEKVGTEENPCCWLLCDWNTEKMLDVFSHLFECDFHYVEATPISAKERLVTYWDVEKEPEQIWSNTRQYLGLEAGIAEIAGRNRIFYVSWYGEEWMPVIDMSWILGQYYIKYGHAIAKPVTQSFMNFHLGKEISGNSFAVSQNSFIVVEDLKYNLYEVGRQYSTRGRDKSVIHILSPDYLLRDFMKDNETTMLYDPKYLSQFVPEYVRSQRNVFIHLIRRLLEGKILQQDMKDEIYSCDLFHDLTRELDYPFGITTLIKQCVRFYLGVTLSEKSIQRDINYTYSRLEQKMCMNCYYHIEDQKTQIAFNRYFRQANYVDETGKERHINHIILGGHLALRYLPGQYATFNGKYYYIDRLWEKSDTKEIVLLVTRASDSIQGRLFYRQNRLYVISDFCRHDEDFDRELFHCHEQGVDLTVYQIMIENFRRRICGYYEMVGSMRWNKALRKKEQSVNGFSENISGIQDPERLYNEMEPDGVFTCQYEYKYALKVEMDHLAHDTVVYFAAVIHEIFYTLYPQYHHLLSVAMNLSEDEFQIYKGSLSRIVYDEDSSSKESFFILEDSMEDIGIIQSIGRNFNRILKIAAEYIVWETEQIDKGRLTERYF